MKKKIYVFCIMLVMTMAFLINGCGSGASQKSASGAEESAREESLPEADAVQGESSTQGEVSVKGEGSMVFPLTVVDKDGNETEFEIHTDRETVGEALSELGLIAGDEGEYGLYVKTVNGITADYDKDGVYWAFYINGEYASSGVDSTAVTEGDSYSFKVEQ